MHIQAEHALAGLGQVPPGVVFMAAQSIEDMRARQTELQAASRALVDAADTAGEDLSEEALATIGTNRTEAERLGRQIEAREAIGPAAQPGTHRRTVSDDAARAAPGSGPRTVPASPRADARTRGFSHLGEFAATVYAAARRDEGALARLSFTNALGMNEGVGEDGGFLVPPEYRDGIMKLIEGEDSLLPLCDTSTTARNSVIQNVDKTAPWSASGIVPYWEGEGQAASASKMPTEQNTLRLNKLFVRVDASDELLDDAPQLDSYLRVKAPEAMTNAINLAIVSGNGVGKPLGFMNSAALISVAKETSQPVDTIMHRNLVAMMGRMYPKSWLRARWLMHQNVWAKLPLLSFRDIGAYPSTATTAAVPAYMPPNGLADAPYGTLFGRPIMVLQAMESIGDLGDIALVDLSQYRVVTKAGGARVDTSIHLKFDTDETVFRFIFRLAGAPWWSAPVSPRAGTDTMSPFISLASR